MRSTLAALNPSAEGHAVDAAIEAACSMLTQQAVIQATLDAEHTGAATSDIATIATERFARHRLAIEQKELPEVGVRRRPAYDTFDDLPWFDDVQSLEGLHEALFHNIFDQDEPFFGDLCCGKISAEDWAAGGAWGCKCFQWPDHPETWRMRSSPPGRAGKPLERGEVRRVAFLVRNRDHPATGFVVNMRLELLPVVTPEMINGHNPATVQMNDRRTWGPHGVSMIGINVFAHHGAALMRRERFVESSNTFHSVLGSFVDLMDGESIRGVREGYGTFALAGTIGGFNFRDNGDLHGHEWVQWQLHHSRIQGQEREFQRRFERMHPSEPNAAIGTWRLLFAAGQVAERYSYAGLLDNLGDVFYNGALPDGMYHPNKLGLLIVMATRLVARPDRFGGPEHTCRSDRYAAREFEAMLTSVLPVHKSDSSGQPVFGSDMVLHNFYLKMQKRANDLLAQQDGDDIETIKKYQDTCSEYSCSINALYRAGAVVLNSVCDIGGCEYVAGVQTEWGEARQCYDAVTFERYRAASEWSPPMVLPRGSNPPQRQSTRAARQQALVKLCCNVERMLRDNTFLNRPLDAPAAAGAPAPAAEPKPAAEPASRPEPAPSGGKKARARAQKADKLARSAQREQLAQLARASRGVEYDLPFDRNAYASCVKLLIEVFANGVCHGASQATGVEVFVLSKHMKLQCASCTNEVPCTASLGLGGRVHNCCAHCKRPRCLACVEKLITGKPVPMADANGRCIFCPDRDI